MERTDFGSGDYKFIEPGGIPEDVFTRCPLARFAFVQVREHCYQCPHCSGFTEDPTAPRDSPERYGSVCSAPIARWWKQIRIVR